MLEDIGSVSSPNSRFSRVRDRATVAIPFALFVSACSHGGGANGVAPTTTVAAEVSDTVPASNETAVAPNRSITVTFDRAMKPSTISESTFHLVGPGAASVPGVVSYDVDDHVATFAPLANLPAGATFTATVTTGAEDEIGVALAADRSWTFTTGSALDTTPPRVAATAPTRSAFGVAPDRRVTATFDEPVDATTLTTSTFKVVGPGASLVSGVVTYAGRTAVFTPDAPLALDTVYTAQVTTGAEDLAAHSLASAFSWTFTTGSARDAIPPTLTSVYYTSSATDVAIDSKVVVAFDEPVDPTTVTTQTFQVAADGLVPVRGTVTCADNLVTFTPVGGFAPNTRFTAKLRPGLSDLAGNPLPGDDTASFSTGPDVDGLAPTLLSKSPAPGATDVAVNRPVTVTLNEMFDPATLQTATFTVSGPGNSTVAGTVTLDPSNRVATFRPTSDFAGNYTATIKTSAKSESGVAGTADKIWTFTTGSSADRIAPAVVSTTPANHSSSTAVNQSVNATFGEGILPRRTSLASFKLLAPGPTDVAGVVTLDPTGTIATFTPNAPLPANTLFTATISHGLADLGWNTLGSDFTWTFTTDSHSLQAPVPLGTAAAFALLASSTIANSGTSQVAGDVGLAPGTAQGLPASRVNGSVHLDDTVVTGGQSDLSAAYQNILVRTGAQALAADLANTTLTPGLYKRTSNVLISSGTLTLDAQGDVNALFVFQVTGTFSASKNTQVVLTRGAKASNVFWQVSSTALVDVNAVFKGTILAGSSITANSGANVEGRLFAGSTGSSAAVTVNNATVVSPAQ